MFLKKYLLRSKRGSCAKCRPLLRRLPLLGHLLPAANLVTAVTSFMIMVEVGMSMFFLAKSSSLSPVVLCGKSVKLLRSVARAGLGISSEGGKRATC